MPSGWSKIEEWTHGLVTTLTDDKGRVRARITQTDMTGATRLFRYDEKFNRLEALEVPTMVEGMRKIAA